MQAVARFQGALMGHRLGQPEFLLKQKESVLKTFDQGTLTSSQEPLAAPLDAPVLQAPTRVELSLVL